MIKMLKNCFVLLGKDLYEKMGANIIWEGCIKKIMSFGKESSEQY